jgi:hypothetical protein
LYFASVNIPAHKINKLAYLYIIVIGLLFGVYGCQPQSTKDKKNGDQSKNKNVLYSEVLSAEIQATKTNSLVEEYKGKSAWLINDSVKYFNAFSKSFGEFQNFSALDSVQIEGSLIALNLFKNVAINCVVQEQNGNDVKHYQQAITIKQSGRWSNFNMKIKLDSLLIKRNNKLKIYISNPNNSSFWIHELRYKLIKNNDNSFKNNSNYFYDFEDKYGIYNSKLISKSIARSGSNTCNFSNGEEYGISIKKTFEQIGENVVGKVSASVWIYPMEANHDLNLAISVTNYKDGKFKLWEGKSTKISSLPLNKWSILNFTVNFDPANFDLKDTIAVGLWNRGKTAILADDLTIVYGTDHKQDDHISADSSTSLTKHYFETDFLQAQHVITKKMLAYKPGDRLLSARFYAPEKSLDCLLHLNSKTAQMFYFDSSKNEFIKVWETKQGSSFLCNMNNLFFAGNFNDDTIADLLVINKQSLLWNIYNFVNNSWVLKAQGKSLFPKEWTQVPNTIGAYYNKNAKRTNLIRVNNNLIENLDLKNENWNTTKLPKTSNALHIESDDYLLEWNNVEFLKLNSRWRFDLTKLIKNNQEFAMVKKVDFKGFTNNCNPKYYENNKLVAGNFTSHLFKSLLVFSFNCNDFNQDGIYCEEIENNKELPNQIQIFH